MGTGSWAVIWTRGQKQRNSGAGKPACTPACTSCPYPLLAMLPVPPRIPACIPTHNPCLHPRLCLPPCLHPLLTPPTCTPANIPACSPVRGAGWQRCLGCRSVLQRRRRPVLSSGTKEPKRCRRYRSKQGHGEAGRVGSRRHLRAPALLASLRVAGQGAGWHCPHAQGWGSPPCTPALGS